MADSTSLNDLQEGDIFEILKSDPGLPEIRERCIYRLLEDRFDSLLQDWKSECVSQDYTYLDGCEYRNFGTRIEVRTLVIIACTKNGKRRANTKETFISYTKHRPASGSANKVYKFLVNIRVINRTLT